ncbi:MAG TPA: VacJ family lipoprotein, partial [Casimicrobiaceae bacterium]|nr:VacJ family lipoprotein [Casimicrobiaceae bacterium]
FAVAGAGGGLLLALAAVMLVAGCAAAPSRDDPFEPMNRASYRVHEVVDGHFIKPMVQAYVDYTPRLVQEGIHNFFGNIDDFFSFINAALQNKPDKAGHDLGRVITNTGFGLLGLIDVASEAGVPKGNEDFGQTFGVWGIPQGPYLFIPVFGPTTVRDGTGWIVRGYASPIGYIEDIPTRNVLWALNVIDLRASALQAESMVNQAALDPYTFIRRAYLQRRRYLVYDGQPPPAKDDDE